MNNDKITIVFGEDNYNIKRQEIIRFYGGASELRLDSKTGVLQLLNPNGAVMSEVDFPTEKIITNAYYDNNAQELVLEFENAQAVRVPINIDLSNHYTIEETNNIIENIKIEFNNSLNLKANKEDVYNKQIVENKLSVKEDKSNLGNLAYKDSLNKVDIGLNNVDNTSDLDKPLSIAMQNALNSKEDKANLKALAYKDNITKEEIGLGNVNNVSITETQVNQISENKSNIGKLEQELQNTKNDILIASTQIDTNKNEIDIIKSKNDSQDTNIIKAQETANEAKSIAQGRATSKVFDTFYDMQIYLKNANDNEFKQGDNLYIKDLNVPDYWISNILSNNNGVYGYYEVSILETQKVDLSNYVEKEEGKGLSSNDFTDYEKSKLSNLQNYDDTAIKQNISDLQNNKADKSELFSGNYDDLINKPIIPNKLSDLEQDITFIDEEKVMEIVEENSEDVEELDLEDTQELDLEQTQELDLEEIEQLESEQVQSLGTKEVQSLETSKIDSISIGKSTNYDIESDEQIPTSKAVKDMIDEAINSSITSLMEAEY